MRKNFTQDQIRKLTASGYANFHDADWTCLGENVRVIIDGDVVLVEPWRFKPGDYFYTEPTLKTAEEFFSILFDPDE
jgi:hypothetical protein